MTMDISNTSGNASLPTLEEIVNLYLWGNKEGVSDKTSEEIPGMRSRENPTLQISMQAFMEECGKFVNAKSFPWLESFFTDPALVEKLHEQFPEVTAEKGYTRYELLYTLGYYTTMPRSAACVIEQFSYIGSGESYKNYQDRSFIWGTTKFMVAGKLAIKSKDASGNSIYFDADRQFINSNKNEGIPRFCIYPDGRREIKNFGIIPVVQQQSENSEVVPDDNFDFDGGATSNYTNAATEQAVDPSGLGKRVDFNFENDFSADYYKTLTYNDYMSSPKISDNSVITKALGVNSLEQMMDRLWDSGVIKFLDSKGKPIIYGSDNGDMLSGTITGTDTDLSDDHYFFDSEVDSFMGLGMEVASWIPSFNLDNPLHEYVQNGIHYIAGGGNDSVTGTESADIIKGGAGDDKLNGVAGDDIIYGGAGDDKLSGGDGHDTFYGEEGNDVLNGGSEDEIDDGVTDTLYGGEGFNKYLVDGYDTIILTGKEDINGEVFLTKDDEQLELTEAIHAEGDPAGVYKDTSDNEYVFDGDALVINDGLRIEGFKKWARTTTASDGSTIWSALGITISEESEDDEDAGDEDGDGNGDAGRQGDGSPDKKAAESTLGDPIIIDLNGNGVETLSGKGVYFDHGGDGVKERTGWVAGTDGFLVRDLNGDGLITTGLELFGNKTHLRDGSTAGNGYQALTELDDNLDGSIDSRDKAWSTLQIWQDKNSDGRTDAGELYTLADAGIAAISTRFSSSTYQDENGEHHRQTGSVTLTDGTTVASADVWFEINQSDRSLINDIPLTPDIIRLPNARGFGEVPDLRQAMANNKILQQRVNDYLAETDSNKKYALLDELIYQWTGVQDVSKAQQYSVTLQQVAALERLTGSKCNNFVSGNRVGKMDSVMLAKEYQQFKDYTEAQLLAQTTLYEELKEVVLTGFNSGVLGVVLNLNAAESLYNELYQSGQYDRLREMSAALIHLSVYSEYNRQQLANLRHNLILREPEIADYLALDPDYSFAVDDIPPETGTSEPASDDDIPPDTETSEPASDDEILRADEYKNLWGGAGNDTYLVNAGEGQVTIADYVLRDEIREKFADTDKERERAVQAGQDTLRFGEGLTSENAIFSRERDDLVITFKDGSDSVTVEDYFYSEQYKIEKIVFGDGVVLDMAGVSALVLAGTDADQTLTAEMAGSEIHAGGGDDKVTGLWGDDLLYGDSGDDKLFGDAGNDRLSGGTGDDGLSGGDGDDVLHGGAGIDELVGGAGADTFIFNVGDGIDIIGAGGSYGSETAQDTLRFGAGIRPEQLVLSRMEDHLVIRLDGSEDLVGVVDYFSQNTYRLAQIVFADGTVWDADTIDSRIVRTLDEAVTYTASEEGGEFEGGNNNDTLTGMAGEDALQGGKGDDWLTGGAGEDYLEGGEGSDTYVFNAGDGQDSVREFADGSINILRFGEGLLAENALAENDYGSLTIRFRDSDDSITLYDYFDSETPPLAQIIFADGTVWTRDAIRVMALEGTDEAQDLSAFSEGSEIHAGGGDDQVQGGEGNDILYGDGGDDVLSDHAGRNILAGGMGNDILRGGDDSDTYLFNAGDGQDVIRESFWDNEKADILRFGDGLLPANARLSQSGNDLIVSFAGSADRVTMEEYFFREEGLIEQIVFADGTVWDLSDIKTMVLAGTDEAQTLTAFDEGSEIHAGGGDDTLKGSYGNDTLFGDAGDDVLSDYAGSNILAGGTGNDILNGGHDGDTYLFNAGDGHDVITERSGKDDDLLRFGEGLRAGDALVERNADDLVIRFQGTADSVTVRDYFSDKGYQVEQFSFSDGTVWDQTGVLQQLMNRAGTDEAQTITAHGEGSEIHAAGGDDYLYGAEGNDILYGDAGNDTLYGGPGSNILAGGTGNDHLYGGYEDDTYLFNAGDGQDVIDEYSWGATESNTDILRFGDGLLADNAVVVRSGNNLMIRFAGSTDQVTVENYFTTEEGIVERIVFADGTEWNLSAVKQRLLTGTDEAQTLTAFSEGSEIHAAGGDDTVNGNEGDDALYGDAGNDRMSGNKGEDTLYGGAGDDQLFGGDADDLLAGGEDNDTLNGDNGNDILYGDDGIDTLNGGSGNDWLSGGEGSDTLDSGSGSDTLTGGTDNDTLIGGYGSDSYLFNAGDGQDTITEGYTSTGDTDTLRFGEGLLAENAVVQRSGDDLVISFRDSTDSVKVTDYFYSSKYQVESILFADGTVWDVAAVKQRLMDSAGTDEAQTITAFSEGSEIHGRGGNDTLNGGAGSDILYGDEGDDVLDSGSGSDTLTGGTGTDTLKGGYGSDSYLFSAGDGQDTITEGYTSTGDTDTLRFSEGLLAENAVVQRSGDDLVISFRDSTDSVKVKDYFYSSTYQVENILFADGTVWDVTTVKKRLMESAGTDEAQTITAFSEGSEIHGRDGNDTLNGGTGSDILYGDEGNDILDSGSGSDTLTGGTGNDTLKGWYGSDTYLFSAGDGQDTITEGYTSTGDTDTLRFGEGLLAENAVLKRSGNDLMVSFRDSTDSVKVKDYFFSSTYQVENILFADGTDWDVSTVKAMILTGTEEAQTLTAYTEGSEIHAGGGNDTLNGGTGSDVLYGDEGNDILDSGTGNDTLTGGTGNDTLKGWYGSDIYQFSAGDGQDTITEGYTSTGDTDILRFGEGLLAENAVLKRSGNDLIVSFLDSTDSVKVKDYFFRSTYQVENITFADGTVWDVNAVKAMLLTGTEEAQTLTAYDEGSEIHAGGGNDTLKGGTGSDLLYGDAGDDVLDSGNGSDTLTGGAGNDTLKGYYGSDTYLFSAGDGQDTITEGYTSTSDTDILRFGEGLLAENAVLKRSGNDLMVGFRDSTDSVKVKDYFYSSKCQVENILFADGTVWDVSAVKAIVLTGTEEAQTLTAYDEGSEIHAGGGNDTLKGGTGSDVLYGEAGNDILDSGIGNDTLTGGAGNDTLKGWYGSDTYQFRAGDGQDTITEGNISTGDTDILRFGEGLLAENAVLKRSGNDLIVSFRDSTDSVKVTMYFYSSIYQVEHITFADGTDWVPEDILSHIEDGIPLPLAAPADAPVSLNLLRQQMAMFTAGDESDNDDAVVVSSLSTSRTTVQSLVNY